MIITESNGDLVLELFYYCLKIAMDKFLGLVTPDSTPSRSNWTSPPSEDEIISPTLYFHRSNGRSLYQRKSLHFDTIMEVSDDCISISDSQLMEANDLKYKNTTEVSLCDSAGKTRDKSNMSFNKDLEEFEISSIHKKIVHSSPKLVTSHFQDSGFLNCSIETSCQFHSTVDDSRRHDISSDSLLLGENSHSMLKSDEKSTVVDRKLTAKSGDKNSSKINTRDLINDVKLCSPAKNQPMSC